MTQVVSFDFRISKEISTTGKKIHAQYLKSELPNFCRRWCFQLEKSQNGYDHFQGRVNLYKRSYTGAAKQLCLKYIPEMMYFAPTSNPCKGNNFYVMKEEFLGSRLAGPYTDHDKEDIYVALQYRVEPNLIQQQILGSAGFNFRHINVLIDLPGGMGKTTACGLADAAGHYNIPCVGDSKDLIQAACCMLSTAQDRHPKLVLVDLPKAFPKRSLYGVFVALEQIKAGRLYDMRYKLNIWRFDSPALWIFMNYDFDDIKSSLASMDRYIFWKTDGEKLIRYKPNKRMQADQRSRNACSKSEITTKNLPFLHI